LHFICVIQIFYLSLSLPVSFGDFSFWLLASPFGGMIFLLMSPPLSLFSRADVGRVDVVTLLQMVSIGTWES
jgi:hypothetical protein